MSATATDMRTGIGARLKAGRERVGMTLLQVAEKLHLDPKVVEALETDQYDQLGVPVYVRGHIKRYAELVQENGVELLAHYSAITKPVVPDLTQLPKAAHHADVRKLVLPSLVVLIAFALIGMVWWILQNVQSTPSAGPQPVPVTTEVPPGTAESGDDSTAPVDAPAAPGGAQPGTATSDQVATVEQSPSAAPAIASRPGATAPPPGPGAGTASTAAARAPLFGNPPPRAGTTAGAVSTAQISKASLKRDAAEAADRARGRSVSVTLKFNADSWVEVYDSKGQRLFYDIGAANSSHALTGSPPLRVVLRNAPAVSLDINGKATRVPASVMQDSAAQFMINRSGRIVRARPDGG